MNGTQTAQAPIETRSHAARFLKRQGYFCAGSTNDATALQEIKRDYLAKGALDVQFNRTTPPGTVAYWVKMPTVVGQANVATAPTKAATGQAIQTGLDLATAATPAMQPAK